jgi:hypothetical protein
MKRALVAPVLLLAACGSADEVGADDTPAPATPEALVAVALSHLTPDPDGIELYTRDAVIDDLGTTSPYIGGQLRWRSDSDWSLSVRVQPAGDLDPCDGCTCEELGNARISWQEAGEDAPGYVTVFVTEGGELRSVGFEGGFDGDPRDDELFVDLDELAAIVTDPAFALTTTAAAIEAGERLDL